MVFEHADESDSRTSDKDYYSLTVERLRALLKERGLSPKGRKASIQLMFIWSSSLLSSHMGVGD
jgi:hypothetical protein